MIVYAVKSGSGCSLDAIFSTTGLANRFIANNGGKGQDMWIEEFTLDDIPDDDTPFWSLWINDPHAPDRAHRESWPNEETFHERNYPVDTYWLRVKAADEETALKIAHERVAKHRAEQKGIA
mgnify:CR=1 FL=1